MSFVNSAKQVIEDARKEHEKEKKSSGIASGNSSTKYMSGIDKNALKKKPDLSNPAKDAAYIFGGAEQEYIKNTPLSERAKNSFGKLWNGTYGHMFDSAKEVISDVSGALFETSPQHGNTAKPIVYSDWSPAAQQFGMDQETAYAEHMANTAHQREIADLRAAGLNPVLGVGSGASGVSGSVASVSSGKKGIDGNALVDVIGATAGLVTTLVSKNPSLGYMVSNVVGKAGDAFSD